MAFITKANHPGDKARESEAQKKQAAQARGAGCPIALHSLRQRIAVHTPLRVARIFRSVFLSFVRDARAERAPARFPFRIDTLKASEAAWLVSVFASAICTAAEISARWCG